MPAYSPDQDLCVCRSLNWKGEHIYSEGLTFLGPVASFVLYKQIYLSTFKIS